jgi:hypothetical protein
MHTGGAGQETGLNVGAIDLADPWNRSLEFITDVTQKTRIRN